MTNNAISYTIYPTLFSEIKDQSVYRAGADPEFQVRGGGGPP